MIHMLDQRFALLFYKEINASSYCIGKFKINTFSHNTYISVDACSGTVVKALCYKLEDCGFETQRGE
jgi:hypothetical protein